MDNVLDSTPSLPRSDRAIVWSGRALTGLIVAFLLIDSIGKLALLAPYIEGSQRLGYGAHLVRPLGVVLLASTVLHCVPRTEFVGAVLLTAYLGGATATHVRTGTPFWFAIAMGVLLWVAYSLRSPQLRAILTSTAR